MFKNEGLEAIILDQIIDNHFISFLEMKNDKVKFQRVDADLSDTMVEEDASSKLVEGEDAKSREEKTRELFEGCLGKEHLTVRAETLKDASVPGMVLLSEQQRRMQEMMRSMGQGKLELPEEHTLVVNLASPVVKKLVTLQDGGNSDDAKVIAEQVYDLAMLAHRGFDREQMEAFLERSNRILEMLGKE